MMLCFFLKSLCETALYFIIANAVLSITSAYVESLLPVFLCAAVYSLAYFLNQRQSALRLLPIPLMLISFQGVYSFGTKLAVGLAVLYTALNIWDYRFHVIPERQKSIFKYGVILSVFLALTYGAVLNMYCIYNFIAVFVLSGIFFLRLARQDKKMFRDWKYNVLNVGSMALSVGTVLLLSSDTFLSKFKELFSRTYTVLSNILLQLMYGLGYGVYFIIAKLFEGATFKGEQLDVWENIQNADESVTQATEQIEEMVNTPLFTMLKVIIFMVAICLLVFYFWKTKVKSKIKSKRTVAAVIYSSSCLPKTDITDKVFLLPRNPREAVRYHYRKFLKLCTEVGIRILSSHNSKDVERTASSKYESELLSKIRNVYIRARYSEAEIDSEDAKEIKSLLKELKEKNNK